MQNDSNRVSERTPAERLANVFAEERLAEELKLRVREMTAASELKAADELYESTVDHVQIEHARAGGCVYESVTDQDETTELYLQKLNVQSKSSDLRQRELAAWAANVESVKGVESAQAAIDALVTTIATRTADGRYDPRTYVDMYRSRDPLEAVLAPRGRVPDRLGRRTCAYAIMPPATQE